MTVPRNDCVPISGGSSHSNRKICVAGGPLYTAAHPHPHPRNTPTHPALQMRGEKVREGERDDIVRLIKAGGRKKKQEG
jgi:hypothetical protein